MKRVCSLLMMLFMLLSVTYSCAENIDLSLMSLDELQVLYNAINQEVATRFEKSLGHIGSGVFVVGEDIKPGNYNLTDAEPGTATWGYVALYQNIEDYNNKSKFSYTQVRKGETVTLSLKEGMVVEIGQINS